MVKEQAFIKNLSGLHLRPAGILCKEAMKYKSEIYLIFHEHVANAKTILPVIGAEVRCGDEVSLSCEGVDEQEAMTAMLNLISDGLGE